jgi:hypothetical protein
MLLETANAIAARRGNRRFARVVPDYMGGAEAEWVIGGKARHDVALEVMRNDPVDDELRREIAVAPQDLQRLGRAVGRHREVGDAGLEFARKMTGPGLLVGQRVAPGERIAEHHDIDLLGAALSRAIDPRATIIGIDVEGEGLPVADGGIDAPGMRAGIGPRPDLGIENQEHIAFRQKRNARNRQVAGDGDAG